MFSTRQLSIVGRLFELEPLRTYPRRGVEQVVELAGATSFRLELPGAIHESSPAPAGHPSMSLPIESGSDNDGQSFGTLYLFGPLNEEQRSLAMWAAKSFSRSLEYARRLAAGGGKRMYEDIHATLERMPLTPRERDVVLRLLSGASTRQIAEGTGLTIATVNTYLKRIFGKLEVHSRVELVAKVSGTEGVVPPPVKTTE